jgi:3',5'-cyclic AMP phosphodiesterase CpdA
MPTLVWLTDVHLNFLGKPVSPEYHREGEKLFGTPYDFGAHIKDTHPNADIAVISGDIAEAQSLYQCLDGFASGWGKPVHFVLGNHDFYGGSFESVLASCRAIKDERLVWLRKAGVVELSPDVAICGNEGWYDGRAADPRKSRVLLSDFHWIKDFKHKHPAEVLLKIRELSDLWAREASIQLEAACEKYKNVVFVTHVPPFPEATWHKGEISNDQWLPWMCNAGMGDILVDAAYNHPDTSILVLCGHTHSPGDVKVTSNLRVLTGASEYWYPQVSQVLHFP